MIHMEDFREPTTESCYEYLQYCHDFVVSEYKEYGAFVYGEHEVPMQEFFADVEKLCGFFAQNGYKKGDVITLFLPTSGDFITAFYACIRSGIIADVVHPLTPPEGLLKYMTETESKAVFMLEPAVPAYGIVSAKYPVIACGLKDYGAPWTVFPKHEDGMLHFSDIMQGAYPSVPHATIGSRETAMFLHGSGTTGEPKTVMISSYAMNYSTWSQFRVDNIYHDYANSYSLCVLPCFHCFGLSAAIHHCMCMAYTPILMPKFDAEKANDYISRYKIQYISGAPTMFRKMFDAPNFVNPGLKNLTCCYSGGDIVSEAFVEQFNAVLAENGSTAQLCRGWGLTEICAIGSTNWHGTYRANSIGKVSYGFTSAIFDDEMHKLPAGQNGQIALGGPAMMNGYFKSKDSGIYTDADGAQWVLTGDMGYFDEDGFLYFTGRKKRIIVISGYNVYPYEIEQKIMTLPYIREACAVQGYSESGKSLVKLVMSLKETDKTQNEIIEEARKLCEDSFYKFSVPRKFEFLEALPRTKMDKLDFLKMSDPVPGVDNQ